MSACLNKSFELFLFKYTDSHVLVSYSILIGWLQHPGHVL